MGVATAAEVGDGTRAVPKRLILVALCFLATFICYIDRVNISVAIIPMAEQYRWSGTTKGLVLSSFFVGYLLAMVPGGALASRIGGKALLGAALISWSLFTILTPLAAGLSLAALLVARIAMGAGEAATFPAVYHLFARWLPAAERSRAVAINLTGIPLGTIFALSASGALITAFGWQSVFYVFGAAGLVFAVVWLRTVHASPSRHPSITPAERARLAECVDTGAARAPVPWRRLLSKSAVWALIFNHFCANWSLYLMLTWLPSYFRDAQHLSVTGAGLFAIGPWLAMFAVGNLAGLAADRTIARGASITRVRKTMQCSGLTITCVAMLAASQATTPGTALLTLCIALGAQGLCWAGFASNHLDIAPRHADVLYALSNTAGTLPGIAGVALTGWLLDVTGGYTATFVVAAAVNLAGAAVWLAWGTGERVLD